MDKPNTLEITKNSIALVTPKGSRGGGRLQGDTVWFGQTPLRFRPELVDEIVAARSSLRDAVVRKVWGRSLYDAIAAGEDVYDRHIENDAYEAGKVLVDPGVHEAIVRFSSDDLV